MSMKYEARKKLGSSRADLYQAQKYAAQNQIE